MQDPPFPPGFGSHKESTVCYTGCGDQSPSHIQGKRQQKAHVSKEEFQGMFKSHLKAGEWVQWIKALASQASWPSSERPSSGHCATNTISFSSIDL